MAKAPWDSIATIRRQSQSETGGEEVDSGTLAYVAQALAKMSDAEVADLSVETTDQSYENASDLLDDARSEGLVE